MNTQACAQTYEACIMYKSDLDSQLTFQNDGVMVIITGNQMESK